jgi:hypothetical protein
MRVILSLLLGAALLVTGLCVALLLVGVIDYALFGVLMIGGLVIIWIMALVDVLRRDDLGAPGKVIWAAIMLFFPVIGMLVYALVRPPSGEVTYGGEAHA